jgi:hypothetical protein
MSTKVGLGTPLAGETMRTHWSIWVVAVIVLASTVAFADIFSTRLGDVDAKQIKRLAVVSVLGDTLHARQVGLTVFQNKSFDAVAPDWGLDAAVTTRLKERIVAGGKITGEVVPLSVSSQDKETVIATARAQGFDAVLAVLPEGNVHDRSIVPGAILLRRKLPGVDKLYPCNGMTLRIYRVADGRQIGYEVPSACSDRPQPLVWHDIWADFTAEEKHVTLDAVQSYIQEQVAAALVTVNVVAH